ncbi:MAG: 50S ribosomal protein L24 [Desulfobacterales bacterium]|jgi:large subunit ribosomal protein L24|nr:50S ribosomal protein L24 [Desulfobacterales bacterium]
MELEKKVQLRKNDIVKVIAGKEKGKVGRVLKVDREKGRIFVEKINMVKRHIKPGKAHPQGGIVEKEAPMDFSNVMIMCEKCNKPTRIANPVDGAGKRNRTCKRCGDVLEAKKK